MNASCWGLLGDNLFFGGAAGVVYQADTGSADNTSVVAATAQQAWNKAQNAYRKRMTAVRPIVQSSQGSYTFGVGFDYTNPTVSTPPSLDGAAWVDDSGSPVTDDNNVNVTIGVPGITSMWSASAGSGTAFSFAMNVNSQGVTSWLRTDYRMEGGDAL
jgi:hypothetical protein